MTISYRGSRRLDLNGKSATFFRRKALMQLVCGHTTQVRVCNMLHKLLITWFQSSRMSEADKTVNHQAVKHSNESPHSGTYFYKIIPCASAIHEWDIYICIYYMI